MGITLEDGQYVGNPNNPNDRLAGPAAIIKDIQKTSNFGLQKSDDPAVSDPYETDHKTSIQTSIFLGPIWIEEVAGMEIIDDNTKSPMYHYADDHYKEIINGKYIAKGNLYIYETKTAAFEAEIAKYKKLLNENLIEDQTISEIVAQRLNLFQAKIETRLLTQFNAEKARELSKSAIDSITTEIVTGSQWDLPKLVIVSGSIYDDSPVIDAFEDISITRSSKTITPDGSTLIRVFSWIAKNRLERDPPKKLTEPQKWELDLQKTVDSYATAFIDGLVEGLRESVDILPMPTLIHGNNIMYSGTLPNTIAGWGPKCCMAGLSFTQEVPKKIVYRPDIHLFRRTSDTRNNIFTITRERSNLYTEKNIELYASPDTFNMLGSFTVLSRVIPSNKNMAFSWSLPTPIMDNTFKIIDELVNGIHGSTLITSFFNVSMTVNTLVQEDGSKFPLKINHAPVRSLSYIEHSRTVNDPNTQNKTILSYKPISMGHLTRVLEIGNLNNWIKSSVLAEGKSENSSSDNFSSNVTKFNKYDHQQWFTFGFKVIGGFGSIIDSLLEMATQGIINIDGLETYEAELDNISIDNISVQAWPMLGGNAIIPTFGSGNTWGNKITHEEAIQILDEYQCVEEGAKFIWSITNLANNDPYKLRLAATWDSKILSGHFFEYATIVIRVLSHSPIASPAVNIPVEFDKSYSQVIESTNFVAPSTFVMNRKSQLDVLIRTDRSYIDYSTRAILPLSIVDKLIPDIFNENQGYSIRDGSRMYIYTLGFTGGIEDVRSLVTGRERMVLSEAGGLGSFFGNIGKGIVNIGRGSLDIVDASTNSILGNSLFSGIGSLSDSITGIDFIAGIRNLFSDSKIVNTDVEPKLVSGYLTSSSYIFLMSTMAEVLSITLADELEGMRNELENIQLISFTASNRKKTDTGVDTTIIKSRLLDALTKALENKAESIDASITKVKNKDIDPTEITLKGKDEFDEGTIIDPEGIVYILNKKVTPPSPFIVDEIHNNKAKEFLKEQQTNESKFKGIKII